MLNHIGLQSKGCPSIAMLWKNKRSLLPSLIVSPSATLVEYSIPSNPLRLRCVHLLSNASSGEAIAQVTNLGQYNSRSTLSLPAQTVMSTAPSQSPLGYDPPVSYGYNAISATYDVQG